MTPEIIRDQCLEAGYVADAHLCGTLSMMLQLSRPLLVEGEAGVGKTAIAKALSALLARPLIRLQCYEGLDANAAVYEWNYSHQLLWIKMQEGRTPSADALDDDIFSDRFLLERPLLKAIRSPSPAVLLIDEVDRADEAFEAFLLEVLSEFQISIPELGTVHATHTPVVVLTSNGTRDLSDALRRRCLYHYLDYPDHDKELRIVDKAFPDLDARLAGQIVDFVQNTRRQDLRKPPGIAETLDWAAALAGMGVTDLIADPEAIMKTSGCLLKTREDVEQMDRHAVADLLATG